MIVPGSRSRVAAVFGVVAAFYILPLFVLDPSLRWAAEDETCCHVPSSLAIQRQGVRAAVSDYTHYRTATAPLYHMIMALVLGRVEPMLIRAVWIAVALAAGVLLYHHVRTDPELRSAERAALALALAFLLSPTIRASAVYFVTDGLAAYLAIVALVLRRRSCGDHMRSVPTGIAAIVFAFASFYTRQFYLWTTLYVAYTVIVDNPGARARAATIAVCLLLALPGVILFSFWRGFTTPLGFAVHTQPILLSTVPNALGLLAVYSLPPAWSAVRGIAQNRQWPIAARQLWLWLIVLGGMVAYVGTGLALGFDIPESGGILRVLNVIGWLGAVVFLSISYLGLVMLLRWLVIDGPSQAWWVVFLLPLFAGSIVLQRYIEPAVLLLMFLVARPADAVRVLDSRLVWFYPIFTGVYGVSRTIHFATL